MGQCQDHFWLCCHRGGGGSVFHKHILLTVQMFDLCSALTLIYFNESFMGSKCYLPRFCFLEGPSTNMATLASDWQICFSNFSSVPACISLKLYKNEVLYSMSSTKFLLSSSVLFLLKVFRVGRNDTCQSSPWKNPSFWLYLPAKHTTCLLGERLTLFWSHLLLLIFPIKKEYISLNLSI